MMTFNNLDLAREIARQRSIAKGGRLMHGLWSIQAWEDKDHERDGRDPLLDLWLPNGITNEGIHYVLDTCFTNNDTAETSWYVGLLQDGASLADADTMASHAGWTEETSVDEATRQGLSFAAASSRTITASISYTMSADKTVDGLFTVTNNTLGGSTGVLFSTALFSSEAVLVTGNTLTCNYTLTD